MPRIVWTQIGRTKIIKDALFNEKNIIKIKYRSIPFNWNTPILLATEQKFGLALYNYNSFWYNVAYPKENKHERSEVFVFLDKLTMTRSVRVQ